LDYYKALRVLALAEVIKDNPSAQYSLRRVFRWYSKEFHTPLHIVEELPTHDVLTHYYESHYEGLEDDSNKLNDELVELASSDEELSRRKELLERSSYDDYVFAAETEKEIADQKKATMKPKPTKASKFSAKSDIRESPGIPDMMSDPTPDIKMVFIDEAELENLANSDGLDDIVGLK
jgi:HEPN domain-containing protein